MFAMSSPLNESGLFLHAESVAVILFCKAKKAKAKKAKAKAKKQK